MIQNIEIVSSMNIYFLCHVKNRNDVELCYLVFNLLYLLVHSFMLTKICSETNITIAEHGIIAVMYTLLTLNMFLQTEKLL